ncbi:hypothetical protein AYI69_g5731, partial [Smittium culicis]
YPNSTTNTSANRPTSIRYAYCSSNNLYIGHTKRSSNVYYSNYTYPDSTTNASASRSASISYTYCSSNNHDPSRTVNYIFSTTYRNSISNADTSNNIRNYPRIFRRLIGPHMYNLELNKRPTNIFLYADKPFLSGIRSTNFAKQLHFYSDSAKTCNPREYKCLVADGEGTLYNFCDDSQILRLYQCPFGTRCYSPKPGNRNVDCLPISQDPNQYYSNQNQSTTTTITGSFDNSSGILTNLNIGSTFSESASIVSNVQDSINSSIQSETNISTSTINTVPSNGITISASSSATTQGVVNAAIPDSTSNNVVTSSSGQIELNGIVLSSSMLAPGVIADKEILVTPKVKLVPTIG